ncbi:TPA: hypothetical protein ACH3X2_009570 [Trebouxia sp. C0005]
MSDSNLRSVASWVLQQKAGSGSFAIVWKAMHKETGKVVAIKEISTDRLNKKLKQSLESEVSILKQIRHKNIVHLEDVVEESSYLYLVMEYCAGGDLAGYIRRCKRVPEVTACAVMRQLGAGLKELWSRQMVHRDLKPQNLLLSDNTPQAVLKIADFGFARHLQQQELANTLCGSPLYMAPEILKSQQYDAKADLWSVGTILYELVVGRPPYNGSNHIVLLQNIERNEARIPATIAKHLSPACIELIYSLLERNPVQRISFEEFFNHPFLAATTPLSATIPGEAPAADAQATDSGFSRPVQRIAGQAANGPEESLPFVLDDDAVAPAFQQPLPEQQPSHAAAFAAPEAHTHRPRYGHRSPASALAGRQLVHETRKQRPPLGTSPRPSGPLSAAKPPSFPNTPPIAAAPLPTASFLSTATQVQGRPVVNHPLQAAKGVSSMGSSMEDDGFVIVNVPSPSSSGHQPISRRPSAVYNTILTRLRSEPITSPQRHSSSPHQQHQQQREQERLAPSPSLPVQQQLQELHEGQQAHQQLANAALQHPVSTSLVDKQNRQSLGGQTAQEDLKEVTLGHSPPVTRAAVVPEAEPDMSGQQAFISMAALLEGLAVEFDSRGQVQKGLSVRLLALQLLIVALQRGDASLRQPGQSQPVLHAQQQHEATPGTSKLTQQQQRVAKASEQEPTEEALQAERLVSKKEMRQMLVDMASKVEEGVKTLRGEEEEMLVPYVWQVVYEAALDFARTAAMQEVIGELGACILPYSQAVRVLAFLHSVAEGLSLQPPVQLAVSDRVRMQSYSRSLRMRQAVCSAAVPDAAMSQQD